MHATHERDERRGARRLNHLRRPRQPEMIREHRGDIVLVVRDLLGKVGVRPLGAQLIQV